MPLSLLFGIVSGLKLPFTITTSLGGSAEGLSSGSAVGGLEPSTTQDESPEDWKRWPVPAGGHPVPSSYTGQPTGAFLPGSGARDLTARTPSSWKGKFFLSHQLHPPPQRPPDSTRLLPLGASVAGG